MNKLKHLCLFGYLSLFTFLPLLISQNNNLPDLEITLVRSPDTLLAGQSVGNAYRFENKENVPIENPFRNALFLSQDPNIDTADILIGELKLANFPANGLEFFTVFAIDNIIAKVPEDTPSGDYFLLFTTDAGNTIAEVTESNNIIAQPLRVNRATDFSVENLDFSTPRDSILPGEGFTLSYDIIVKNEPSLPTKINYTLTPLLENLTNPVNFSFEVPALPIGRHSFNQQLIIPLNTDYGFYASFLEIDPDNQIEESDEFNNVLSSFGRGFQIINQLEVLSVSCPSEIPQPNGILTFDIIIKNTSATSSPATSIGFFQQIISINSPDRSEPRYGITDVPSIAGNETITVQLIAQLPGELRIPGEITNGAIIRDYILSFSPSGQGVASIIDLFCNKSRSDLQLELDSDDLIYGLTGTENSVNLKVKVTNNGPETVYNIRASLPSRNITGSFVNTATSANSTFVSRFQSSGDFLTYLSIPELGVGEVATLNASYLFFTPDNPDSTTENIGAAVSSPSTIDNLLENNAAFITYFREGTLNTSCTDLVFTGEAGIITIDGLTPNSRVEIIGQNTNYQTLLICDNDCSPTQLIEDLEEGAYTVKVNLFDGEKYCYREEVVSVKAADNNGNGIANCDALVFTGADGQIIIEGLTASSNKVEIIGHNTDWQVLVICDGDCSEVQIIPDLEAGEYAVKINQSGADGSYCYREEVVQVEGEGNTNGSANCDELVFSSSNDSISITGLTASYDKVEIIGRNTDWQVVTICDGDCADTQFITGLQAGEYAVKVNQGGNDGTYCYRETVVLVDNGSNSRNSTLDFGSDLVLYPNPARDRIHLRFPSISGKTSQVQVFNTFGQRVHLFSNISFEKETISIDLGRFENGVYLMAVQVDGLALVSRRFVVEHLK